MSTSTELKLPKNVKITILSSSVEGSRFGRGYNKKYYCQIKNINNNRSFNITFHDSIYNYENNIKLNKNDVMYSVLTDARCYEDSRDINDFFHEFGYEDIKQGLKAFEGCKKEYNDLYSIFSVSDINDLYSLFENY